MNFVAANWIVQVNENEADEADGADEVEKLTECRRIGGS